LTLVVGTLRFAHPTALRTRSNYPV